LVLAMKESFWGDLYDRTKQAWKQLLELAGAAAEPLFISTRQMGPVMATQTGEVVSPQMVSRLTRDLEGMKLLLVVTDAYPELGATIQTVYRGHRISVAGFTRCATFCKRYTSAITTPSKPTSKPSISADTGRCQASGGPGSCAPLAQPLSRHGAATGARSAGAAVMLQLSPPPVAETANDHYHRALFRGGAADATDGALCERSQCRSNHLLDVSPLQPGMENSHFPGFYTSSLTSISLSGCFSNYDRAAIIVSLISTETCAVRLAVRVWEMRMAR
jgi:hypothetical protein